MGKFILGIIIGIAGVAAGSYIFAHYGFVDLRADQPVNPVEFAVLGSGMDAYADRHAPKVQNPVPPTDENLIAGIRIYKTNCVICHGGPDTPTAALGQGFYPRVPQFKQDPPDMPQNQNFWIIKHGIRWTAMPAWEKVLSDKDIWKVVTFLSKWEELDKLPPAVQQEWKSGGQTELGAEQHPTAPAAASAAQQSEESQKHQHHHH